MDAIAARHNDGRLRKSGVPYPLQRIADCYMVDVRPKRYYRSNLKCSIIVPARFESRTDTEENVSFLVLGKPEETGPPLAQVAAWVMFGGGTPTRLLSVRLVPALDQADKHDVTGSEECVEEAIAGFR
jgi:hypothetical protein